jgi:DNA (cytosine-5)-methyltransferase 1
VSRPRLLDLYCGAGGASMGYHRAGFEVWGVDRDPQPRYPFRLIRGDACTVLAEHGWRFDAYAASPPCQVWTAYKRRGGGVGDGYVNLIPATREALEATGKPYIIENIEPARAELRSPVLLCGSMFDRNDGTPLDVQRHRLFESSGFPLTAPRACDHNNPHWTPRFTPASNRTNLRKTVEVGVYRIPLAVQRHAMGIDWMRLGELSEAIPPAYTEHLGHQLLGALGVEVAA